MKYKPHDYQKFAVDFIETHPEAAVLLECGLGKTSITLTALNDLMFDKFEVRKVLIIARFVYARIAGLPRSPSGITLRG